MSTTRFDRTRSLGSGSEMPRRTTQEARDWELFTDWCESMGLSAFSATADTVAEFLHAFPAPIRSQGRRVRSIRRHHSAAGAPLHLPTGAAQRAWREGDEWASLPQALAQLPVYRHQNGLPMAIRGRRDGWLLVLVGLIGLTRGAARNLAEHEVSLFPKLSVAGKLLPRSDPPVECPACAATRWLRVAGAASFGWRRDIVAAITPEGDALGVHDCAIGLDGTWRHATTLLPGIDRHGWVSAEPMSARAISATMALRQVPGPPDSLERSVEVVSSGRFARASMNELADAYDDVDERAAALLLRLNEIVGEGDEMLDRIKSFSP